MKSENDNIGIGLACSKDICVKMGGDIILKTSHPGLTVFAFKIPIKVIRSSVDSERISISEDMPENNLHEVDCRVIRLFGSDRPIPDIVSDYLNLVRVFQNSNQDSEQRQ